MTTNEVPVTTRGFIIVFTGHDETTCRVIVDRYSLPGFPVGNEALNLATSGALGAVIREKGNEWIKRWEVTYIEGQ